MFGSPYLGDPRLDRVMGMVLALAGELAVTKAQLMDCRARLAGGEPPSAAEIDAEMGRFVTEFLAPLTTKEGFETTREFEGGRS